MALWTLGLLAALTRWPSRAACPQPLSRSASPQLCDGSPTDQATRSQEKLRQLFGDDYKDAAAKELSRVTSVQQPKPADEVPEWQQPQPDGVRRMTLWLESVGVNLDNVVLVEAEAGRMALVAATDVTAGATLFDVPDEALLTADSAFVDPDVGRALRTMSARVEPTSGFDTFAIAAMLAAERVRRGSVLGRLRRQDGGAQVGLVNFARDGSRGELLPQWETEEAQTLQGNRPFSPLIGALPWPSADECVVDVDQAEAVKSGAKLIATMIEPAARTAWMKATQRAGLLQSTSTEDVDCRAVEALVVAMDAQLQPPPPIGVPSGERRWGGSAARDGPAICPLVNLVLPPPDADADAARAMGVFNSQLGRPSTGNVNCAIRCVAATDMAAGTLILSDVPGASGTQVAKPPLRPKQRVAIARGELAGRSGVVLTRRPQDGMPLVRLDADADGGDTRLVPVPDEALTSLDDEPAPKKQRIM